MAPKKPDDRRSKEPGKASSKEPSKTNSKKPNKTNSTKSDKTKKLSKGVSKASKGPKYRPTSHKGRYTKGGRWICTECNSEMAGTKKTIFWHGQKKHNAKSTYAKDQAAGLKIACSRPGCKSMTSTANSYLQHHRSAHKFVGSSAGLKANFRRKQEAAAKKLGIGGGDDSESDADEDDEPTSGGDDDYLSSDGDDEDEPSAGAGAAAGAPLPIAAA